MSVHSAHTIKGRRRRPRDKTKERAFNCCQGPFLPFSPKKALKMALKAICAAAHPSFPPSIPSGPIQPLSRGGGGGTEQEIGVARVAREGGRDSRWPTVRPTSIYGSSSFLFHRPTDRTIFRLPLSPRRRRRRRRRRWRPLRSRFSREKPKTAALAAPPSPTYGVALGLLFPADYEKRVSDI